MYRESRQNKRQVKTGEIRAKFTEVPRYKQSPSSQQGPELCVQRHLKFVQPRHPLNN